MESAGVIRIFATPKFDSTPLLNSAPRLNSIEYKVPINLEVHNESSHLIVLTQMEEFNSKKDLEY